MPIPSSNYSLFIVGPTGTGKTGLAVKISSLIPSLIISADSRQVYRGMDIVTGKDHPKDLNICGIDIVNPDEECSVTVWQDQVNLCLEESFHFHKLPIYVGGTGFYIKSIVEPFPTLGIGINEAFRKAAAKLSVEGLQSRLRKVNPAKFYGMNHSDSHNPRRLIRAIEVAEFGKAQLRSSYIDRPNKNYQLIIGLSFGDTSIYKSKIRDRVMERVEQGAIEETKKLLAKYEPTLPSLTAIGYRSIRDHLTGSLSLKQMIDNWTNEELAYAKRQMTWFRKVPDIVWYDANDPSLDSKVAELVLNWYDKN